jgi:hypothetical protein
MTEKRNSILNSSGDILFSLRRRDNSGAHPVAYAVGDGALSLGVKLNSQVQHVPSLRIREATTISPLIHMYLWLAA